MGENGFFLSKAKIKDALKITFNDDIQCTNFLTSTKINKYKTYFYNKLKNNSIA